MKLRMLWLTVLVGSAACTHDVERPSGTSATGIASGMSGMSAEPAGARAALDANVPRLLTEHTVPSVSIALIEDGRTVLAAAYGSQSPGVPATRNTLYNIASLSKPISAEVILRLVSQGRLTLDESMAPDWVDPDIAQDERHRLLTPRLALSHQTGFPNWRRETKQVLKFLRTPGTAFGYSGEGYEYVARFAQKRTGSGFESLAQSLVFDPAGMQAAYTRRPWFEGRIAVPADDQGKGLEPGFAATFIASDLVYTTPTDYARFMLSVLADEGLSEAVAKERSSIQVSRKAEMCTPARAATCPLDVGMGLGWEIYRFAGDTYLMHTGNDEGVFTLAYVSPTNHGGLVIFTNGANGPRLVMPILDLLGRDEAFVEFLRSFAD